MKIINQRSSKPVLIVVGIMVLLIAGLYILAQLNGLLPWQNDRSAMTNTKVPTAAEIQDKTDAQKTAFAQKEQDASEKDKQVTTDTSTTATTTNVPVTVTYAEEDNGVISVNSYTPHYADGNCTFTFTQGSSQIIRTSPGTRDATTTICTNPQIKVAEFPNKGVWTLVVSYSSNGVTGNSDKQTVTVQ